MKYRAAKVTDSGALLWYGPKGSYTWRTKMDDAKELTHFEMWRVGRAANPTDKVEVYISDNEPADREFCIDPRVHEIGKHLPGGRWFSWVSGRMTYLTRCGDGLTISIYTGYGLEGRYEIMFDEPELLCSCPVPGGNGVIRHNYSRSNSIKVSQSRTEEAIAKDIARRLLPEAEERHEESIPALFEREAGYRERYELWASIRDQFGFSTHGSGDVERLYYSGRNWPTLQVMPDRTIELRVRDLSQDQLSAIMEVLGYASREA